MVKCS